MVNIVFTGWGTWWHVFPIKSLIEYIYKNNEVSKKFNKIFWFWMDNSLEKKIFNTLNFQNLYFVSILSWKIRREKNFVAIVKNIFDMFLFFIGIFQCLYLLIKYKVDVIFCKWGFVAGPVVVAWWLLRKKIYMHESDIIPWLANKLASKFATVIYSGFPDVFKWSRQVGQILWDELLQFKENEIDLSNFDLAKTNIICVWWSQWAKTVYQSVLDILDNDTALSANFNFFVVLGTQNVDLKDRFAKYPNVKTFDFANQREIWFLFNLWDMAITRGSATFLTEQKSFGLKSIIVPLPYTWWNHQYYNGLRPKLFFGDILVLQDPKLKDNIQLILQDHIGFKKEKKKNIDFDWVKKIIINDILNDVKNK